MTKRLQQAFAEASKLRDAEQDSLAAWLIEDVARRRGAAVATPAVRLAALRRSQGMLRDMPTSSDDWARQKAEEKALEERKWPRR